MIEHQDEGKRQIPPELGAAILALASLIPADVELRFHAGTVEVTGLGDPVRRFAQGEVTVETERFYGGQIAWRVAFSFPLDRSALRPLTIRLPEVQL